MLQQRPLMRLLVFVSVAVASCMAYWDGDDTGFMDTKVAQQRPAKTKVEVDILMTDLAAAPGWRQKIETEEDDRTDQARPRPLTPEEAKLDLAKLNGTCWDFEDNFGHTQARVCPFHNVTRKNVRYTSQSEEFLGAFSKFLPPAKMIFESGDACAGDKLSAEVEFRCPRPEEHAITEVVASNKESFCVTRFVVRTPWVCSIPNTVPMSENACRRKSQDLEALEEAVLSQFANSVLPEIIAYGESLMT